ncbi:hypothetical protein [Polynucleobacter sp. AP-Feld-500C-C5]|uniref:hypothetical protein n=1 Tax=Polynucleobacter sp. AP-Feld-500C-C5 TaxID=2576924 RepID=UPI001C0B1985|nr:hypothetical protein [Polynucleobacter sp. AP-Feld-500C-C5]
MKKFTGICFVILTSFALVGCLASTASPVGVNCDYSQGKPLWEMPLDCQGR